jgi:hypothetical protein
LSRFALFKCIVCWLANPFQTLKKLFLFLNFILLPTVDCKLTQWSSWGTCSSSCDTGIQFRQRRIMSHAIGIIEFADKNPYLNRIFWPFLPMWKSSTDNKSVNNGGWLYWEIKLQIINIKRNENLMYFIRAWVSLFGPYRDQMGRAYIWIPIIVTRQSLLQIHSRLVVTTSITNRLVVTL